MGHLLEPEHGLMRCRLPLKLIEENRRLRNPAAGGLGLVNK
jgi:hypothetical protein